ncbi:hypothetical protein N7507_006442 [Penicillium longicatenatum]|nr:hypothetical protein N7507_006442 [Penicillium longicatenatum]
MKAISVDQINNAIARARDNTNAAADTDNFQAILSTLDLDQAQVEILAEQDRTPGWTLNDAIRSISRRAIEAPGKSIVLIHYAGHGEVRGEEPWVVKGPSRRSISLQDYIDTVVKGHVQYFDIADTDAVFVLESFNSLPL